MLTTLVLVWLNKPFFLKWKSSSRRQRALYMVKFSRRQRRAEGGQARPQMDSV